MNPIDELINLFQIKKEDINDNLMDIVICKTIEFSQIPTYETILNAIKKFNERDYVKIHLKDETEDSITISNKINNEENYRTFIGNNKDLNSNIDLNISISKNKKSNKISIFNIDSFLKNFIIDNLEFFNYRFEQNSNIIFVNYDNDYMFNTNSIIMVNNDKEITIEQIDRKELIERCNSVSNFANSIEYKLLPEDFAIISTNIDNDFIKRLYEIKILFSLLYIVDYSLIDEEKLKLKLNGYRNKEFIVNLKDFKYSKNYEEFYNIYRWIFQDSNEYDKISVTRNIISLNCKYCDILDIDERLFLSIKSNYKIYLKDNVDKYIELKNKLTDFITDTSIQINNIIDSFIDSFKKNIIAFITFLLGTYIANLVSDNPLDNILTNDVISITCFIIWGSIVYLAISIIESIFKFKSYKNNYNNLKRSYEDLLEKRDINIIFKNDEEYKKNRKTIKRVIILFSITWIILILGIFIGILVYKNVDYIVRIINNIKIQ